MPRGRCVHPCCVLAVAATSRSPVPTRGDVIYEMAECTIFEMCTASSISSQYQYAPVAAINQNTALTAFVSNMSRDSSHTTAHRTQVTLTLTAPSHANKRQPSANPAPTKKRIVRLLRYGYCTTVVSRQHTGESAWELFRFYLPYMYSIDNAF